MLDILSSQGGDISITVHKDDLLLFANTLVEKTRNVVEKELHASKKERLVPKKEVLEILGKGDTTLHNWKHSGYLVPVKIGKSVYYKWSDLDEIINGKK